MVIGVVSFLALNWSCRPLSWVVSLHVGGGCGYFQFTGYPAPNLT